MTSRLGCHIICFPSGRYGYVGAVPSVLGTEVPASTAAVLGQRAYRTSRGVLVEVKFPSFETETAARAYAASCGVSLSN